MIAEDSLESYESILREWTTIPAEKRAAMGKAAQELYQSRYTVKASALSLLETFAAKLGLVATPDGRALS